MTASFTFDIFSSLDGYSNSTSFGGYFGKQGPEFLEHRLGQFGEPQRLILGANTFRGMAGMLASVAEHPEVLDPWVTRMWNLPTTVVSNTLDVGVGPGTTVVQALDAGLLTELRLDLVPVTLGSGTPMLEGLTTQHTFADPRTIAGIGVTHLIYDI